MSTNFFDKLQYVNNSSDLIISGYFRKNGKQIFGNKLIPEIIEKICLLYYYLYDEWDPQCIGKQHILRNNTITRVDTNYADNNAFGKIIVCKGHFDWRFKIKYNQNRGENVWEIVIGIWRVNESNTPPLDTFFTSGGDDAYKTGYGFMPIGATMLDANGNCPDNDYGIKCKSNDIIEMHLDLDQLTLQYTINNVSMGVAMHIKKAKYRAAIFTLSQGTSVEMLY